PNARISLNSHRCVNLEPLPLLWQRKFFQQRVRGGTGGPNQSKTLDSGSVGELDFGLGKSQLASVRAGLETDDRDYPCPASIPKRRCPSADPDATNRSPNYWLPVVVKSVVTPMTRPPCSTWGYTSLHCKKVLNDDELLEALSSPSGRIARCS